MWGTPSADSGFPRNEKCLAESGIHRLFKLRVGKEPRWMLQGRSSLDEMLWVWIAQNSTLTLQGALMEVGTQSAIGDVTSCQRNVVSGKLQLPG